MGKLRDEFGTEDRTQRAAACVPGIMAANEDCGFSDSGVREWIVGFDLCVGMGAADRFDKPGDDSRITNKVYAVVSETWEEEEGAGRVGLCGVFRCVASWEARGCDHDGVLRVVGRSFRA